MLLLEGVPQAGGQQLVEGLRLLGESRNALPSHLDPIVLVRFVEGLGKGGLPLRLLVNPRVLAGLPDGVGGLAIFGNHLLIIKRGDDQGGSIPEGIEFKRRYN